MKTNGCWPPCGLCEAGRCAAADTANRMKAARYWTRKRFALALLCIALHIAVVVNVWVADQHTPRVFTIQQCAQHTTPRGVTI